MLIIRAAAASLALGACLGASAQSYTTQGFTAAKPALASPAPTPPSQTRGASAPPSLNRPALNETSAPLDESGDPAPLASGSSLRFGPIEPGMAVSGGSRSERAAEAPDEPEMLNDDRLDQGSRQRSQNPNSLSLLSLAPQEGRFERESGPSIFNGRWIGYAYGATGAGPERAPGFACQSRGSVEDDLFEVEALGRSFRAQGLAESAGGSRVSGVDQENQSQWTLSRRRSLAGAKGSVSAENSALDWRCALASAQDFQAALAQAQSALASAPQPTDGSSIALAGFEIKEGYIANSCAAIVSESSLSVFIGQGPALVFERDRLAFERANRASSIHASPRVFYKGASVAFSTESSPASRNAALSISGAGAYAECQLAPSAWWSALLSSY